MEGNSAKANVKGEDLNGRKFVVPTKDEFDDLIVRMGFTQLSELLRGYAILCEAQENSAKNLSDPEFLVGDAIVNAQEEIENDIFSLFVCVFKDFAEKEGGAK